MAWGTSGRAHARASSVKCFKCGGPHYANNCDFSGTVYARGGGGSGGKRKPAAGSGWEGMKVPELRAECKVRGLVTTGKKADLVRRLKEDVASKGGGPASSAAAIAAAREPREWTEEDDRRLWCLHADEPISLLAKSLNRSEGAIPARLGHLQDPTHGACQRRVSSNSNGIFLRKISSYTIGDEARPNHYASSIQKVNNRKCITEQVRSLSVRDNVFVRRSDGKWTFAVIEEKKAGVVKLRTATMGGKCHKILKEASWAKHLRLIRVDGSESTASTIATDGATVGVSAPSFAAVSPSGLSSEQLVLRVDGSESTTSKAETDERRGATVPSDASAPPSGLTSEQLERMARNLEEARLKKKARLSSSSGGTASTYAITVVSQSPASSMADGPNGNGAHRHLSHGSCGSGSSTRAPPPAANPYLQKIVIKRDDSRPELEVRPTKTNDDLPPLHPGCPPVREDTRSFLSGQQLEVVMAARPPPSSEWAAAGHAVECDPPRALHHMVRVNAAAGTGKTTTLFHLAARCIDLQHKSVCYLTFSRAAAADANDRMRAFLDDDGMDGRVVASTMHSCAMRLLSDEPPDEQEIEDKRILNDIKLKKVIEENWGDSIDSYLKKAMEHVESSTSSKDAHKLDGKLRLLREKVCNYLFKTFENFTRSKMTLEALKDGSRKEWSPRHYYPVKVGFKEGGEAAKLGFPPSIYSLESSYSFYADTSVEIWKHVIKNGIRHFNTEMKKVQLQNLRIPCSVLLVDECQDLDGCQVAWIEGQKEFGTHIFFVGDSAQCIYGFRGAKSTHVMKLDCIDLMLTESRRFGPEIARVVNTAALYPKEKSSQTLGKSSQNCLWIPYRVIGAADGGEVTTKPLLPDWQQRQITLIGATNGGLMMTAMKLLGLAHLENPEDDDYCEFGNYAAEDSKMNVSPVSTDRIPKIHINGRGDMSGGKLWKKNMKTVRILYELMTNKDESEYLPMTLPTEFKDFADVGPVTWPFFNKICKEKELMQYVFALSIVSTYKQNTLQAVDAFDTHVLANECSVEDADIILTTVHSAKGLEWDHVELCDDLLQLSVAESLPELVRHPSFLTTMPSENKSKKSPPQMTPGGDKRKGWQFVLHPWQDQCINMLYVALTRARKTLSVPSSITSLLEVFDRLHYLVGTFMTDASGADGRKVPLSSDGPVMMMGETTLKNKGDVWNLYHDLVVPLRNELEVADDMMILPLLFVDREAEPPKERNVEQASKFEDEEQRRQVAGASTVVHANIDVLSYFDCRELTTQTRSYH